MLVRFITLTIFRKKIIKIKVVSAILANVSLTLDSRKMLVSLHIYAFKK